MFVLFGNVLMTAIEIIRDAFAMRERLRRQYPNLSDE